MLISTSAERDATSRSTWSSAVPRKSSTRRVPGSGRRQGIQRKLILTFVPLILVIILVLAFLLLRDFSRTILAAVNANGEGLADRTASVVKANPTDKDRISLDDYFAAEQKKNRVQRRMASTFRYNTLSFYRGREGGRIRRLDEHGSEAHRPAVAQWNHLHPDDIAATTQRPSRTSTSPR